MANWEIDPNDPNELEDRLERWMEYHVREHIEATFVRHLTDMCKVVNDYEKRHSRRWKALITSMLAIVITNICLTAFVGYLIFQHT